MGAHNESHEDMHKDQMNNNNQVTYDEGDNLTFAPISEM